MKLRTFVMLINVFSLFFVCSLAVGAQDAGTEVDSLFGDEVLVPQEQSPPSDQNSTQSPLPQPSVPVSPSKDPVQALLKSEAVRIGGSITGKIDVSWTWNDPWTSGFAIGEADSHKLMPTLSSLFYLDARPEDTFRVHSSFKTSWPFSTKSTFLKPTSPDSIAVTTGSVVVPNISIFELFSDFQVGDSAYFRFGKATVKWGVGYFFSPADIINLEQISLFDATAQREGPIQFRIFFPYGQSQNTLSFYAIFPNDAPPDFKNTALAGKAEFIIGNYELGMSGYYRNDTTERVAITVTGPMGPVDIFAEGVAARGSPKAFYSSFSATSPYAVETTVDVRTTFYPSATAGFIYNDQNNNISAIAQYYYNGEGYSNADRTALFNSFAAQPAAIQNIILYSIANGDIKNFPIFTGLHYAGGSLSFSKIGGSDFSVSTIGIINFSDISGLVQPSIGWQIADYLSLKFSTTFGFGAADTEYGLLLRGKPITLGFSLSAGTGNF